jgi:putative membrane protein
VTAFRLAWYELRRFRGRLPLMALAFLVIVPTLYGSLYLWSNWDPYGGAKELPVAVVNEDRPVTVDGRTVDAGAQFVSQLKADDELEWHFTDAADAADGLDSGDDAFVITVPPDFSAKLASPQTGTPQRAQLMIRLDDANGYIVGVIAETVEAKIQSQINAAAISAYAETALGGFAKIRDGLGKATTGARKLASGADTLHDGTRKLDDGLKQLRTGSGKLTSGADQVSDGTQQLAGVVDTAASAVTSALAGLDQVSAAAGDAQDVAGQLAKGSSSIQTAASDAQAQVAALAQANPDLASDPAFQALSSAVDDAASRSITIAGDAADAATQLSDLAGQVKAVADRRGDLAQQIADGRAKVDELARGAKQVASGAAQLDTGVRSAKAGSGKLVTGSADLEKGAQELADQLAASRKQVPASDPDERSQQADTIANPVALDVTNAHPARVYGRGLAPFFLSIALWVFGIVAFLVLRPVVGETLVSRLPARTVALGAYLPAAILSLLGAALLYLVVDVGLGLDPISPGRTLALMFLSALAFVALVHLLRVAFGAIGDALALVLLVLQLAASGGIYPIQTAPAVLRAINPVLPMTYLVQGYRVAISGGQTAHLTRALILLAGLLVVALALTTLTLHRQRFWTVARLKPDIEL